MANGSPLKSRLSAGIRALVFLSGKLSTPLQFEST
jgi:hypothetical protein